jgi:hypothetical protein
LALVSLYFLDESSDRFVNEFAAQTALPEIDILVID